jgi:Ran-interacting Mog1 protein
MASYTSRELYGGAITANLPADFIDASNLRQVPDHQEVYLSPTTLTTIIFEINQYVKSSTASQTKIESSITEPTPQSSGNNGSTDLNDKTAALYHLRDLIDPKDTLNIVRAPKRVQMQQSSARALPAFIVSGKLTSNEQGRPISSVLPAQYQHGPSVVQTSTTLRLLLIRIEDKSTDLCVTTNVPWKELEAQNKVEEEEGFADSIMENVVASLDVKDAALFGD